MVGLGSIPVESRGLLLTFLLAATLVAVSHSLFAGVGLDLSDEGFLWHGVERTRAGEVPLRDFQSYEPGRYYWVVAFSPVLGDGILGLRRALSLFQLLGLFAGLLVVRRLAPNPFWMIPIGLILLSWMFPRHKIFEPSLAMMAVYVGVRLLESQNVRAFGLAGGFVGFASFFGRNHALYSGLGILLLAGWIQLRSDSESAAARIFALGVGGLVGCVPLLAMLLFIPGFALGLWDSILFFAEQGANLPTPIPWPWLGDYSDGFTKASAAKFLFGTVFVLIPCVYAAGLFAAFQPSQSLAPERIVLLAASAIGLFYLHHVAIRSDPAHLGQAISPLLLAALALPGAFAWRRRTTAWITIGGLLTILTISIPTHYNRIMIPPWQARSESYVPHQVGSDTLRLPRRFARSITRIESTLARRVPSHDSIFIAPYTPGLYSVLGKMAPVWGLYFLWNGSSASQARMLSDFAENDVRWALISDGSMDGRDELRFRRTHPLVWDHLMSDFRRVKDQELPSGLLLFQRNSAPGQIQ